MIIRPFGRISVFNNFFKSNGVFKTTKSGDFNNNTTWLIKEVNNSTFDECPYTPDFGNDMYIESGHTVRQIQNQSCNNLNINTNADVIRLNNNGYILDIYGKLRVYTGSYPGTSDGSGAGIAGYLGMGTLRFKGTSRTGIALGEFSPNANNINATMDVALDSGQTLTITATIRFGYLTITSGTLEQGTALDIRLAGDGTLLDVANMQGVLTIKNGATLKGGLAVQRAATSAMKTMTLEAGGVLWITRSGYFIGAQTLSLLGEVIMDATGTVTLPNNTGRSFAAPINTYATLTLQNSGTYTLQFNTTINTKLRRTATSSLSLNSFTLSYGANADLEYVGTFTTGSELPTNGSYTANAIPRNLIVNGGVLTLNGNKIIKGSIILQNGGSINYNSFTITTPSFKTVQSGNYNDLNTWNILDSGSSWLTAPVIPSSVNDVYVEAGHTLTLTTTQDCKDLNLNTTADVIRINTDIFKLNIYGNRGDYTGNASSPTFTSASVGIQGWIRGWFRFTGLSRDIVSSTKPVSSNAASAIWTMEIDAPGQKLTMNNQTVRCGFFVLTAGEFEILPNNTTGADLRISGIDTTAQPGDLTNGGTAIFKSGSKFSGGYLRKNNPTNAKNGIDSLVVETGAIYNCTVSGQNSFISYSLLGEVWYAQSYAQTFMSPGGKVGCVNIVDYSTIRIGGTGAKTLVNNINVSSLLSFGSSSASLALGGFTVSYGISADLEYTTTYTSGVEFVTNGSGTSIPRNLIVNGGVLTLNSNKNIRGTVIFKNGGSINYNGFTLTTPAFRTVQLGNYDDVNTWNIYNNASTSWVATTVTPTVLSDIYIRHGVQLTGNSECRGLYIKMDVNAVNPNYGINFQTFNLNVNGDYRNYSGDELTIQPFLAFGVGAFTQTFLSNGGGITVIGKSRVFNYASYMASTINGGSYYLKINLDTTSDTLSCGNYLVGGETIEIIKGVLYFTGGNTTIRCWRVSSSQLGGDIIVRNGGKILDVQDLQTSTTGAEARSLTIDAGGIMEFDTVSGARTKTFRTLSYVNNGTVIYSSSTAQATILPVITGATLTDNANITFTGGASIKTLQSNLFIKSKLSIGTISSIALNSKTLTYDTNGDLEYTVSQTKGNELPNTSSGVAIPRNLILAAGVVLNLGGGTVNIRGTLSLGAGASVTNGTLNQNQP